MRDRVVDEGGGVSLNRMDAPRPAAAEAAAGLLGRVLGDLEQR